MKNLMNNPDIIMKPTDKGGGLVLMDKSYYRDSLAIKRQLDSNVYQELSLDSDKRVFKKLKSLVEKYRGNLTKRKVIYLTKFQWQSSHIYCTPKVHKCITIQEAITLLIDDYIEVFQPEHLKRRTIISGPESSTQRLSCLMENLLKPIDPYLTTYVKDDWDFLRFLPSSLNFDSVLYSCDIENLYTSIPFDRSIEAIDYLITRKRNLIPEGLMKEFIIDSIKFCFKE